MDSTRAERINKDGYAPSVTPSRVADAHQVIGRPLQPLNASQRASNRLFSPSVSYGYFNKKVLEMRGLQWRFHPHACPTTARDHPFGYAAVASQSWIRNMIVENWLNSHSMILDYIEKGSSSDWAPMLGESRSFKDRLMSPPEVSATPYVEKTMNTSLLLMPLNFKPALGPSRGLPRNAAWPCR